MGCHFFSGSSRIAVFTLSLTLVSALTLSSHAQTLTYQFGSLRVDVEQRGTSNYPMDGVKARMVVTNTGTTAVSNIQLFATLRETGQSVVSEPQTNFPLDPGESQTVSCTLGEGFNSLPNGVATTRTLVWTLGGGNGTLETPLVIVNWVNSQGVLGAPPAGQGMAVSVQVVDENGQPLNAFVSARGGSAVATFTSSGQAGAYGTTLPPSTNWVVSAEATGRRTAYLFLTEARDYANQVLTLVSQTVAFTYQPARMLETGVGPWLARVNAAEDAILVTSGMEHWSASMQSAITQAKLRLYSTTGQKRWEYAPGYEAWGADLSRDGRWAAVATLDPSGSSSGVSGPAGTLTLLDAGTGQPVWQRALDTTFMNSPPPAPGSQPAGGQKPAVREVRFAPDASILAVGDNLGDLVLVRRTDPSQAVWTANLRGQVRAIQFSADGQTIYAAAGSGFTAAYRAADGTQLWRAVTYAWVHPEGMVLSPDGTKLGVVSYDGDVMMFDAATGRRLWYRDTRQRAWWASFSGDGSVFLAGIQTGATLGLATDTGTPLFALNGGKGGGFATGKNYFLLGNLALYDQTGTRLSNFITGLDNTFGNWQVAWVSPDGLSLILGQQESQSMNQPVLFHVSGQASNSIPSTPGITGAASGPLTARVLSVTVQPASAQLGTIGQVFVAAEVGPRLYFLIPAGWQVWTSGSFPAYTSGVLAAQTIQVLDGSLDLSGVVGAQIYVGYGTNAAEMLANSRYAMVHRV